MAKSKKGNVVQMLSPENYIRKRARSLPLFECLINHNWQETQLAHLVVARQHTNGNITAGVYLVDLACLGVKDTTWLFNKSLFEFRENMEEYLGVSGEIEKIDYSLAHNIVYAGIEFAGDYEFKPHKDFTSLTQFILEEESDDIPVVEIDCGIEGLPAYMQGPVHTDRMANHIIAQLERVAGPGNYFLLDEDGLVINDKDDFDDEEVYDEQIINMTHEEKCREFLSIRANPDMGETRYLLALFNSLLLDLVDDEMYDNHYDELWDMIHAIPVNGDEIPDEMLGVAPGSSPLDPEEKELFWQIIEQGDDIDEMKRLLGQFRKSGGPEAAADYLNLLISIEDDSKNYLKYLETAAMKYPDYALVQFRWNKTRILNSDFDGSVDIPVAPLKYFKDRESMHPWEQVGYIDMLTHHLIAQKDLTQIDVMRDILKVISELNKDLYFMYSLCLFFQFEWMSKYCQVVLDN
ncbi:MAG: hypothetical protein KKA07_18895 [Bacteroidetes bacterium]|nr:hypothetical protein [Bacteroidota bacterium]MBU1721141.1 hypothetical protein [Bacteroidota bacterium]